MSARLSVIVVTYMNPELVDQCLESIYKYNDIGNGLEIIISDNSPDESIRELIDRKYKAVYYTKNENIGFGAGNNVGVKMSSAPYLLFLNPDTILIEPVFKFAVEKFESGSLMFGVQLLNRAQRRNTSFSFIDCFTIRKAILGKVLNKYALFVPKKMTVLGADIFIDKEVFIRAGMFDEKMFMYAEEYDLTKRVLDICPYNKVSFYKGKAIIHLEGGTTKNNIKDINDFVLSRMKIYTYYCNKWSIPLKKVVLFYIRRYRLLAMVARVKGEIEDFEMCRAISRKYKDEYRKVN